MVDDQEDWQEDERDRGGEDDAEADGYGHGLEELGLHAGLEQYGHEARFSEDADAGVRIELPARKSVRRSRRSASLTS